MHVLATSFYLDTNDEIAIVAHITVAFGARLSNMTLCFCYIIKRSRLQNKKWSSPNRWMLDNTCVLTTMMNSNM